MHKPEHVICRKSPNTLAFIVLCCLITAQALHAQTPGMIKGVVVDENNIPFDSVRITLIKYNTNELVMTVYPQGFGKFKFSPVYPEQYCLFIEPIPSSGYPVQYWGQDVNTKYRPEKPILMSNNSTFNAYIKLAKTPADTSGWVDKYFGAVEGRLLIGNTNLSGVTVAAVEPQNQTVLDQTFTDQYGWFVLYHVPSSAPHNIKFTPTASTGIPPQFLAQGKTTIKPVYTISVPEYNTIPLNSIFLSQNPDSGSDTVSGATIKIFLSDSTSTMLFPHGYIRVFSDIGNSFSRPLLGDSTQMPVVFYPVPAANYTIFIETQEFPKQYYNPSGNTISPVHKFWVPQGQVQEIKVTLTSHPADTNIKANITGYVKNTAGQPIQGASVYAVAISTTQYQYWFNAYNIWSDYSAQTDSNGNYSLFNMSPGTYVLIAQKYTENYVTVFYPASLSITTADKIIVTSVGMTKTANFDLRQGAQVTGYVKDNTGNGIDSIRANLYASSQSGGSAGGFYYETRTEPNGGRFVFRGIPPGTWHAEAWDENNIYYRVMGDYEDITTSGTMQITLNKNIIMKAGGMLYGKYSSPITDTSHHYYSLGRIFIYPENLNLISSNDTANDVWKHAYININRAETLNTYRSTPIPEGRWRMALSPNPNFDMMNFPTGKLYIPFLKWSFIDNASTLASTMPMPVIPFQKKQLEIKFNSGGYIMFGKIASEHNELFGFDTVTQTSGKYASIRVYIREAGGRIQIAEGQIGKNNWFAIPGLVDGAEYFFCTSGDRYPDQWWMTPSTSIKDSTTSNAGHASPYVFSASANFKPLKIFLREKPEDFNNWNDQGPSWLKNVSLKPVGLSSIAMTWSPSPDSEHVVRYMVYRLKNASESLFKIDSSGQWWEPVIPMDSLMQLLDSFPVPGAVFTDNNVSPFIKYMYVPVGVNDKGHEGRAMPASIPLSAYMTEIKYTSFLVPAPIHANQWHMVGVCGLDSIKPYPPTLTGDILEMYYWDEKSDSTKLYSHYKPMKTLHPKTGTWVYTSAPAAVPLVMTENAFNRLVANKDAIALNLFKGWNQVSSPFPYGVAPSWLDQSFTAHEWADDINGYRIAQQFKPWKAYWIYASNDTTLAITPNPSPVSTRGSSKLCRDCSWEIGISLTGENSADPDNFIGVLPAELSNTVSATSPEPPQAFDLPHLYFMDGDTKLSRHYVFSSPVPKNRIEWKVGISASDKPMTLTVNNISAMPEELSLFWIHNDQAVNLSKTGSFTIPAHNDAVYGYIVATANPGDLNLYAAKLALHQNFPNPFRSATTIQFTVPYSLDKNSTRAKVSLNIYNLSGRIVATVYSGLSSPGVYSRVWNGRSNSQRDLPSGIYIARLECGDVSKTIRMFKVK